MEKLSYYHQCGEELERELRLKTYPMALKLLEKESDIPEDAKRPTRDLGFHLSLCQAFQLSRREGATIAMLLADNWCFEPVVGFGLAAPPERFLQGHNRFPRDVASLEAGSNYAQEFPKLPTGKYIGVATAPLRATPFEPDVVVTYCDSAQLSLLLLGREYKEGRNLQCPLSSHAACVYAVVPALQERQCQVAIPCRGDHYLAMAGDEEMIFTVPREELEDLMVGLRHVRSTGSRLPRAYTMRSEYQLGESYQQIAKIIGYI